MGWGEQFTCPRSHSWRVANFGFDRGLLDPTALALLLGDNPLLRAEKMNMVVVVGSAHN